MITKKQRGVGLIEALIAFLVVGVGIAALVKLEGVYLQSSSETKARTVALSLAQEKLDDLRGFTQLESDANKFDYLDIGANTGGALKTVDGVLVEAFPSGTVSAARSPNSNVTYTINWTVANGYWTGSPLALTYTTPSPAPAYPDQKRVTVTVTWVDQQNVTQSAQLQGIIAALSPQNTDAVADSAGGASAGKPQVFYTPSTDTGVVAVSIGETVSRETLVPTTTSDNQVRFTAYTYNAAGLLLRQEDFLTVSCNCEFTTAGSARTPGHAKWDADLNSYKDQDGTIVTKDKGQRTGGGQDELCDTCCQDHHDAGSSTVDSSGTAYCDPANGVLDRCFDPFRGSSDFTNGKHNHYTSAGAIASSGAYLESCRMKRINGFWRVYQDWHRVDMSAFPLSTLSSGEDEGLYATYVGHIIDDILNDTTNILDSTSAGTGTKGFYGQAFTRPQYPSLTPDCIPSSPNTPDDYSDSSSGSGTKPCIAERSSANNNPVTLAVGQQSQLTARTVYVDYLSPSLLTQVRNKKTANQDYLVDVPFYEIEVTSRAPRCASGTSTAYGGWCPPAGNTVSVGGGDIADHHGNGLLPGQVEALATTGGSSVDVAFSMRRSNSGLMGLTTPVDVHGSATNRDIEKDTVNVAFNVTGSGSTTHTLTVTLSGATPTSGSLVATPTTGSGNCTGSGTAYSCTVPNSVGGSLTFSGSTETDTCNGTSNYTASTSNQSITLPITCHSTSTTHTLTVTLSGGTPATGTLSVTPASGTGSCIASSSTSYSCAVPNDATGDLSFSGTTSAGGSCSGTGSYTSSASNQSTSLTITCQTMRTLSACVTSTAGTEVRPGGSLTPSTAGSCAEAGTCGSGNKGANFSCSVPNGVSGTLSFTGLRKSGSDNIACSGSTSFSTSDANINLSCN